MVHHLEDSLALFSTPLLHSSFIAFGKNSHLGLSVLITYNQDAELYWRKSQAAEPHVSYFLVYTSCA